MRDGCSQWKRRQRALTHPQPQNPQARTPKPCAQHPNRCTQGFVLCVQPTDFRVQPSRPRSDKVRSIARDAFSVGREGFSVASNRLTLALAVEDLPNQRGRRQLNRINCLRPQFSSPCCSPNTHRSSRIPSRCASCVAQSLGLKAHPLMARSACGLAYNTVPTVATCQGCWLEAKHLFRPATVSVISRRRA